MRNGDIMFSVMQELLPVMLLVFKGEYLTQQPTAKNLKNFISLYNNTFIDHNTCQFDTLVIHVMIYTKCNYKRFDLQHTELMKTFPQQYQWSKFHFSHNHIIISFHQLHHSNFQIIKFQSNSNNGCENMYPYSQMLTVVTNVRLR